MPPKTKGKGRGASTSKGRGRGGKTVVSSSSPSSHEQVEEVSDSSSTDSDTQPASSPPRRPFTTRRFADATMDIDEFGALELDAPSPAVPSRPVTAMRTRSKRTHPASETVITTSKKSRHASVPESSSVPASSPPLTPSATPIVSTMPHTPTSTPISQSPQIVTPIAPRNLRVFNTDFHRDEDSYRKLVNNRPKKVFSCRSVSFRGDRAIQSLQEYFVDWLPYLEFLEQSRCFEYPVRCFYANISSMPGTTPMKSYFLREITVTPDLISQIIRVPNTGADIFADTLATYESYGEGESAASASRLLHGSSDATLITSEHFVRLASLPRCIARIVGGSIFAKSGNRDKTTGCHKLLTYLLLKKVKVNLPLLLYKIIWHGTHYGRSSYPHGTLISSILTHHGLDLSTFPEIARKEPFSQKNLSLMEFKAQGEPITLETPLPRSGASRNSQATSSAGPSSAPPQSTESAPASVIPSAGPSSKPMAPASSEQGSRYPDLLSILPLFSVAPTHRVSLREAIPLLQNSLLGLLNDNIRSHNETRDAILTALGLPTIPPRPLYSSPLVTSTVSSPCPPPVATTPTPPPPPPFPTQPGAHRVVRFDEDPHIIASADLSHALDAISLPSIDSDLAALSEIIADIAASAPLPASSAPESTVVGVETAPTSAVSLISTSALAPVFTLSEIVSTEPHTAFDPIETSPLAVASLPTLVTSSAPTTSLIVAYSDSESDASD